MRLLLYSTTLFFLSALTCIVHAQNQQTGALPTPTDIYAKMGTAPLPQGSNIPALVDLSNAMPPAGNQGQQSSCVAWACAYANYSYLNQNGSGCEYIVDNEINETCLFSPSFIYNQINGGQNRGTSFYDAFQIMRNRGCATLGLMPYNQHDWRSVPLSEAIIEASSNKINSYWQLGHSGVDIAIETKAYLAKGIPVIAAVKVDNYLMHPAGYAPNPYVWEARQGQIQQMGHAILIVGYDENNKRFKFLNSYGTDWGNNGYGYISYDVFNWAINEAFIIRTGHQDPDVQAIMAQEDKYISTSDIEAGLEFKVTNVEHVFFPFMPSPEQFNNAAMTFHGSVRIPPGFGDEAQIVIYFYVNDFGRKGQLVYSSNPFQRSLSGQAVTGAPAVPIKDGFENTFWAKMRYVDLNLPSGIPFGRQAIKSELLAEPVLLLDGFPIRIGELLPFFVQM